MLQLSCIIAICQRRHLLTSGLSRYQCVILSKPSTVTLPHAAPASNIQTLQRMPDWIALCCRTEAIIFNPAQLAVTEYSQISKFSYFVVSVRFHKIAHRAQILNKTRMWANAQRDGRPAKYRWRPLFNAAKFGWRALLECRAVTLPRRETRWKLHGCPKLANRSQPLVGRSPQYYQDM